MTDRSHLSIGEVLSLLREEFPDVTISKIRFLESQGLVDPERTPSGYRKFYDHDVDRLRWILRQQREHFLPLKVIRGRLTEQGEEDDLESESSGATVVEDLEADDTGELPLGSGPGGLLTSVQDGGFGPGPEGNGRPAEAGAVAMSGDAAAGEDRRGAEEDASRGSAGAAAVGPAGAAGAGMAGAAGAGMAGAAGGGMAGAAGGGMAGAAGAGAPGMAGVAGAAGPADSQAARAGGSGSGTGPGGGSAPGPESSPVESGPAAGDTETGSGLPQPAIADAGSGGTAGGAPGLSPGAPVAGAAPASQTPGPPARPSLFSTLRPPSGARAARPGSGPARLDPVPGGRSGSGGPERREMRLPARPGAVASGEEEAANFTMEELAAAAGGPPNLVSELKQYGLIAPHAVVAGTPYYDEGALTVARAAASFAEHGIEVRHLKPWRNSAEREAGLFEQVVLPLLRQRNPQSRQQATETLADLARLGGELRAALVDLAIREIK